jgi:hypothetical protein
MTFDLTAFLPHNLEHRTDHVLCPNNCDSLFNFAGLASLKLGLKNLVWPKRYYQTTMNLFFRNICDTTIARCLS